MASFRVEVSLDCRDQKQKSKIMLDEKLMREKA